MEQRKVFTPGGARDASQVHEVPPGHSVDVSTGRYLIVGPKGETVKDCGEVFSSPMSEIFMPHRLNIGVPLPRFEQGWIAYAGWSNGTGRTITKFTTELVVPQNPTAQNQQLLFLFCGIQNATQIYQPVLQWGDDGATAPGGNYWFVATWLVTGQQGGPAFHSPLKQVFAGDVLVMQIELTAQTGNQFSYSGQFVGIADSGYPVTNIAELTWCAETLEAYRLSQCAEYPAQLKIAFRDIAIETGGVAVQPTWGINPGWSPSCAVICTSPDATEVDILFRPQQ